MFAWPNGQTMRLRLSSLWPPICGRGRTLSSRKKRLSGSNRFFGRHPGSARDAFLFVSVSMRLLNQSTRRAQVLTSRASDFIRASFRRADGVVVTPRSAAMCRLTISAGPQDFIALGIARGGSFGWTLSVGNRATSHQTRSIVSQQVCPIAPKRSVRTF